MEMKFISYNCRSVRAQYDIVKLLTRECDIILLQETMLNDVIIVY